MGLKATLQDASLGTIEKSAMNVFSVNLSNSNIKYVYAKFTDLIFDANLSFSQVEVSLLNDINPPRNVIGFPPTFSDLKVIICGRSLIE